MQTPRTQERTVPATLTVAGRLLHTRWIGLAAVLCLAGLLLGVAAIHAALQMKRVDTTGLVLEDGRLVATRATEGGLLPGDVLVGRLDHRRAPRFLPAIFAELPAGKEVTVHVERGVTVTVPTAELALGHAIALWGRVAGGVLVVLLGFVSFVLRPGTRPGWLFFAFCLAIEVVLLFNVVLQGDDPEFLRVLTIGFALDSCIGLHLFCEFPRRMTWLARRPWLAVLIYLPGLPLILGGLLLPLGSPRWELLVLVTYLWSILAGIGVLGILISGLRRARRADDARLVGQHRTLLVGIALGLFLPMGLHLARAFFGVFLSKWAVHVNAAPTLIYPLLTAYAMLRQNVLGADRFTTAIVGYAATLALVGAGCGLVLVGVPLLLEGRVADSPLALVLTSAAASLSVVPLYRRLKKAVDRRFLRDRASDGAMAGALRELMRIAVIADRERTLDGAVSALGVLGAERVEVWLAEGGEGEWRVARRRGETGEAIPEIVRADGELGRALVAEKVGGLEAFAESALPTGAQGELWELGLALAAPVPMRGDVAGFVALGRRVSGLRYDRAEQSFLAMVAAQIGLALERGAEDAHLGRYRLERRLGVGGMAEVHVAWQVGLAGFERRVALKRPLPDLLEDPESIAMFLGEAQLAAQLNHPNIVQIYEVDRHQGQYYIAMEYVEGASLRTLLRAAALVREGSPTPLPVAAAIADALLRALGHAHEAHDGRGRPLGIVHRDVTPSNVLVADSGAVKLVDFGVARSALRLQKTQTGVIKGTLPYMSPEQSAGGELDARSDLYSAAVVLVECLRGKTPQPQGPPRAPAPPPRLDELRPRLATALGRALAWDPAQRWQSAEEMRRALLEAFGEPPAPPEVVAAWVRELRHRPAAPRDPEVREAVTAADEFVPTVGTRGAE